MLGPKGLAVQSKEAICPKKVGITGLLKLQNLGDPYAKLWLWPKVTVAHRDKTLAQIENTCTNHKTLAQIRKHLHKLQNTCTNYKTIEDLRA